MRLISLWPVPVTTGAWKEKESRRRRRRRRKKNPRRCNKSPFTPSFVKLPPCAAPEGSSLRLTGDNTNSAGQLSRKQCARCSTPEETIDQNPDWVSLSPPTSLSVFTDQTALKATVVALTRARRRVNDLIFRISHLLRVSNCVLLFFLVTMSAKLRGFVLRDHFRNKRNVRGYSGYARRGRPLPLELTSPLCGLIPTLLPDRSFYSIGGRARPTPGRPLAF